MGLQASNLAMQLRQAKKIHKATKDAERRKAKELRDEMYKPANKISKTRVILRKNTNVNLAYMPKIENSFNDCAVPPTGAGGMTTKEAKDLYLTK